MTGRPRRLHGFFSQQRRIAVMRADRDAAEAAVFEMARKVREAREAAAKAERQRDAFAVEVDQLRARLATAEDERGAAAKAAVELADIRGAVIATGRFDAGVDLVVAIRALNAERIQARAKASDLETARRLSDVEAYKLIESNRLLRARADRSESAEVAELKAANLKLSDQLAELRAENERLCREAAPYGVMPS